MSATSPPPSAGGAASGTGRVAPEVGDVGAVAAEKGQKEKEGFVLHRGYLSSDLKVIFKNEGV